MKVITRGFSRGLGMAFFLLITVILTSLIVWGDIALWEKILSGVIWAFCTLLTIPVMTGELWDWVEENRETTRKKLNKTVNPQDQGGEKGK